MHYRLPCDDYCPLVSAVCCGLPEYKDVQAALKLDPPLVWMCHSDPKIPCASTNLKELPEGAIAVTEPETIPCKVLE